MCIGCSLGSSWCSFGHGDVVPLSVVLGHLCRLWDLLGSLVLTPALFWVILGLSRCHLGVPIWLFWVVVGLGSCRAAASLSHGG